MPTQKIVTLYLYDELPTDKAKEAARDWYREASQGDDHYYEGVYEDFHAVCATMGVDVGTKVERYGSGKTRDVPAIFWTGFWSQGDGASFEGGFKSTGKAGEAVREYAPQDANLHGIADAIDAITANYANGVTAEITRPHDRYYHEYTMSIDAMTVDLLEEEVNLSDEDDKTLTEQIRSLARWLYRQLEAAYDDANADETVEDNIRGNEYTFTEDGKRDD